MTSSCARELPVTRAYSQASMISKVNTALQLVSISSGLCVGVFPELDTLPFIANTIVYITAITTLASLAEYIRRPGYIKRAS